MITTYRTGATLVSVRAGMRDRHGGAPNMERMFRNVVTRRLDTEAVTPLVTCYGSSPEERSEFSARSFANWVDKTANLLADEFDVTEGDGIALPVLATHPHHWMAWVWLTAAWQVGAEVTVDGSGEIVVDGPDATPSGEGIPTVACSLHPLGMPLTTIADGVIDYVTEVRGQPDSWLGVDPDPGAILWQGLTWNDLEVPADDARRLVCPRTPQEAIDALLAALPGGSVVSVPSTWDAETQRAIAEVERVTA